MYTVRKYNTSYIYMYMGTYIVHIIACGVAVNLICKAVSLPFNYFNRHFQPLLSFFAKYNEKKHS